jgi:SAM-dependent methyltransferase
MLRKFLAHPLTRGLDIDDPRTAELRRFIVREKSFLRKIYQEWYMTIAAALPPCDGPVLELGSGAGFLREYIPGLVTSEVFPVPGVSVVLDAHDLPFCDGALRAIVMTNVLHHLARPRRFFAEAARCVKVGGAVLMIEPWVTAWSRLVYRRLHYEPFDPEAANWEFPESGPLSGANNALPWILFVRDRQQFESEFPAWQVRTIQPLMPIRYLLSGGVTLRALMPGWTFGFWRMLENGLRPWMTVWGMFALVTLTRRALALEADEVIGSDKGEDRLSQRRARPGSGTLRSTARTVPAEHSHE